MINFCLTSFLLLYNNQFLQFFSFALAQFLNRIFFFFKQ